MAYNKIFLTLIITLSGTNGFLNVYPKLKQQKITGDPGEPLYLTSLIESGKIDEARNLSQVINEDMVGTKSYSGYLTVNKKYNSNMFFWFFPSKMNYLEAPVVLWLQGGPGATSLFGLFTENGPFIVKHKSVKKRKYTWTEYHSVIYIDNPVGTGYSFTENNSGYAKNEEDVAKNLYEAIVQFFKLFPELRKNDFFVTGESYAGKYVPALSYAIHQNNANFKVNLKGLAMGNGFSDPINQLNYGAYLYQLGLIDLNARLQFFKYEQEGAALIRKKQWKDVAILFDKLLDGDLTPDHKSLFKNATGFNNYYNYLKSNETTTSDIYLANFIQSTNVRKSIHVGKNIFNGLNPLVEINLVEDIYQSVAPWIITLLNHYKVLVYNGQLDIIVAYPMTVNYLQKLRFSAANEYKRAQRHIWKVGGDIAGYVKSAGNLTEILVRDAGHMVPSDQPKWAMDMIMRFTHNKPFY